MFSTAGTIKNSLRHVYSWLIGGGDFTYLNPNYKTENDHKRAVIYCVHGTADRSAAFSIIANLIYPYLPEDISAIKLVAFDHRAQGVGTDEFARQLRNKIQASNDQNVILMGHSRGGLVVAYFKEFLAQNANINVQNAIPICAPFQGSKWAIFFVSWFSESVKQMERESDFLRELNTKMLQSAADKKYFFIGAEYDYIVPAELSCPSECEELLKIVKKHGHLSIMTSIELAEILLNFLFSVRNDVSSSQIVNQFSLLETESTPLSDVCVEISNEIERLMRRFHIFSSSAKVEVLMKLISILTFSAQEGFYQNAKTIGEVIDQFLQDERFGMNNKKPIDILSEKLNIPFNVFSAKEANSKEFIEELRRRYADKFISPLDVPSASATAPT